MKKLFVGVIATVIIAGGAAFAADKTKSVKKQETKKECKKSDCPDKSNCPKTTTCPSKPGCVCK